MRVLEMGELTPEALLSRLDKAFLESQSDGWTQGLYEFFGSQTALRPRLGELPIVRLANGSHVSPKIEGDVQAFLPGPVETDFPTVREAVCRSEGAREFLKSLNLTEPDPVDNVIPERLAEVPGRRNGRFGPGLRVGRRAYGGRGGDRFPVAEEQAGEGIAGNTVGQGGGCWQGTDTEGESPKRCTWRRNACGGFSAGIEDVRLLDSRIACLRGEEIRELLERSGAARYLQPMEVPCDLSRDRLSENQAWRRAGASDLADAEGRRDSGARPAA